MEQHIIEIGTDGTVSIAVSGVKGKACKDVTAQIEKALGKVTKDIVTSDFYSTEKVKISR